MSYFPDNHELFPWYMLFKKNQLYFIISPQLYYYVICLYYYIRLDHITSTIKHLNQIEYIIIYSTRTNNLKLQQSVVSTPIESTQHYWYSFVINTSLLYFLCEIVCEIVLVQSPKGCVKVYIIFADINCNSWLSSILYFHQYPRVRDLLI